MSDILYFKVESKNELAGLFQSDDTNLAEIEIFKLKISQPQLKVKQIDGAEYYELMSLHT